MDLGKCNIDHSRKDVIQKLQSQEEFLPKKIQLVVKHFLMQENPQETLNDLFHLLKKYDLSSEAERQERNKKMLELINS